MADREEIAAALERIRGDAGAGRLDAAEDACWTLVREAPQEPEGWSCLGQLMLARRRWSDAEIAIRQALVLVPNSAKYDAYLSDALRGQGRATEAESCARNAVSIDAGLATAWFSLGTALGDQRRWGEAASAFRESVARDPLNAAAWGNLGTALHASRQLDAAQLAFETSLSIAQSSQAAFGYAQLLSERGQARRAIEVLKDAVAREPGNVSAWELIYRIGALADDRDTTELACSRVLELVPHHLEARYYLADVLVKRWDVSGAERVARQLVAEAPDYGAGWLILGSILARRPACDEAAAALRRAVVLEPSLRCHDLLLTTMQYGDGMEPDELLRAHHAWDAVHGRPFLPPTPPVIGRGKREKVTLGFLSHDLDEHPVGFLGLHILERLDRDRCRVAFYLDRVADTAETQRLRAASDCWREVCGVGDEEVAERIRADEVDVLFDLSGHLTNRLQVFARKPAPVQVTWLGYAGTTGLSAIDYLLADRFHVREGEERFYAETVLRMPHGYACYAPPADAPEVGPLPARESGRLTLGCFNNPAKFSRGILDAWAEILRRAPRAVMLFKFGWLSMAEDQQRLRDEFERRGVSGERILIEGGSPRNEFLQIYNRVDLALDTQPFSGGVTTCEALWMGVPVITFPGKTFAGRHATSHLMNAGYPQFVAKDVEGYIELAAQWAHRLDELAEIRAGMRERVRNSPLCDAPRFARDFLNVIEGAWRARVDGAG
jgi:protein O-GlcNAc transferase